MKKLAASLLLPLLLVAAVQPPAAILALHANDSLPESGQVAPLRPAPVPNAASPGLPVLSDTPVPGLASSETAARVVGATMRSSARTDASLARAHSRACSIRARHASYVHRLRASRGSVPVTASHPPPSAST